MSQMEFAWESDRDQEEIAYKHQRFARSYVYLERAYKTGNRRFALRYFERALSIDPDNIDAVLSRLEAEEDCSQRLSMFRPYVLKWREKLVKHGFWRRRRGGKFWDDYETRDYLRLLCEYGDNLVEFGCFSDGLEVFQEMLAADSGDHLARRFAATALTVHLGRWSEYELLVEGLQDETESAYVRALAAFRQTDEQALAVAFKSLSRANWWLMAILALCDPALSQLNVPDDEATQRQLQVARRVIAESLFVMTVSAVFFDVARKIYAPEVKSIIRSYGRE